jgi:hypothetical protein
MFRGVLKAGLNLLHPSLSRSSDYSGTWTTHAVGPGGSGSYRVHSLVKPCRAWIFLPRHLRKCRRACSGRPCVSASTLPTTVVTGWAIKFLLKFKSLIHQYMSQYRWASAQNHTKILMLELELFY